MRESTYALKLHISDFAAMATLKVKNAMFFKVKESCIKPAAGYRSTETMTVSQTSNACVGHARHVTHLS